MHLKFWHEQEKCTINELNNKIVDLPNHCKYILCIFNFINIYIYICKMYYV